jgi:hypothetical protein
MSVYGFITWELDNIVRKLSILFPKHTFQVEKEIRKTSPSHRVGFFRHSPLFSARRILDDTFSPGKDRASLILTSHTLVKEAHSINSSLHGGVCLRDKRLVIVSSSRMTFEQFFITIQHELGHLFGLPHCLDEKCLMQSGVHDTSVSPEASTFCEQCHSRCK